MDLLGSYCLRSTSPFRGEGGKFWNRRFSRVRVFAREGLLAEPICMDRLPFASEDVLSEVADMYPASRSARGPWPSWEYARTFDLISGQAVEQPVGSPDSGCVYRSVPCSSSIASSIEAAASLRRPRGGYRKACRGAVRSRRWARACWPRRQRACSCATALTQS